MSTLAVNEIIPTTGNSIIFTSNVTLNGTGALSLPVGSTADRPTSPSNGMIRYNTTLGKIEAYVVSWCNVLIEYNIEYILVAGGGGAGFDVGGGGGGGGVLLGNTTVFPQSTYTFTIGSGGGSGGGANSKGTSGGNTSFSSFVAVGGGGGGTYPSGGSGLPGGSGGGAGNNEGAAGGAGIPGQGYPGGTGISTTWGSAGGGGAGGPGSNAVQNTQVAGGPALYSTISGSNVAYSGGGYGNSDGGAINPTGQNIAGASVGFYGFGANGTGAPNASPYSGNGGIAIIRYQGSQRGSGGNVTTANGYTIHTFTSTSSYTA